MKLTETEPKKFEWCCLLGQKSSNILGLKLQFMQCLQQPLLITLNGLGFLWCLEMKRLAAITGMEAGRYDRHSRDTGNNYRISSCIGIDRLSVYLTSHVTATDPSTAGTACDYHYAARAWQGRDVMYNY